MANIAGSSEKSRPTLRSVLMPAIVLTVLAAGTTLALFLKGDFLGASSQTQKNKNSKWQVGDVLPPFTYTPFVEGAAQTSPLSSSQLRGKLLLLNFWASWCPPCIAELPSIQALAKKFEGQGLDILLVNYDDKPADAVPKMVKKLKLGLPIALDPTSAISELLNFEAIPVTVILGPERSTPEKSSTVGSSGRIVLWLENGERDWNSKDVQERISLWLKNPEPLKSK